MINHRHPFTGFILALGFTLLASCGGGGGKSGPVNTPPSFSSPANVSIDENQVEIMAVVAQDPQGNAVEYSITGGADQSHFTIGASTGALRFTAPRDFELPVDADANNVYIVQVTASDGALTANQTIEVTVNNVVIESTTVPVFSSAATVSINENFTYVMTVTATDADGNNLFYSVTGGADAAAFSIDIVSGALVFNSAPDFENPTDSNSDNVYEVQVTVTDGVNNVNQTISVTVLDLITETAFGACLGGSIGSDTLYADQWHLKNTGQDGGTAGEDINVEPAWAGCQGTGVRIVFVDDGLEIAHEDLAANVLAGASWDYVQSDTDPTGGAHGTAVAGVAAAVGFNGIGVRGVAPNADILGYNLLQNFTTGNESNAMTRDAANNAISSNSWGPQDGTGLLIDSEATWRAAIETGLTTGRGGKGLVYTWAAGNGHVGPPWGRDNSNYDGLANYHGVMAIAALNDKGQKASYSEQGANIWVSTPAGEFCDTNTTTTTDRTGNSGYNTSGAGTNDYADRNYTQCFNGTSSATPVAAGAVALMLEANPNLGWRDVRQILAQTARKNNAGDSDWTTNGAGFNINHKYGFGIINAEAAVIAAAGWTNLGAQVVSPVYNGNMPTLIPDGIGGSENIPVFGATVSNTVSVSASGIAAIEYVEVTYTSNHTYAGDLEIELQSPAGTVSRLANVRWCNIGGGCGSEYATGWRFGSARHLGEGANGNWILRVKDGYSGDTDSVASSWSIRFYGH